MYLHKETHRRKAQHERQCERGTSFWCLRQLRVWQVEGGFVAGIDNITQSQERHTQTHCSPWHCSYHRLWECDEGFGQLTVGINKSFHARQKSHIYHGLNISSILIKHESCGLVCGCVCSMVSEATKSPSIMKFWLQASAGPTNMMKPSF